MLPTCTSHFELNYLVVYSSSACDLTFLSSDKMLSEDNTVALSLSDDDTDQQNVPPPLNNIRASEDVEPPSLLDDTDDVSLDDDHPPSKLRLDTSVPPMATSVSAATVTDPMTQPPPPLAVSAGGNGEPETAQSSSFAQPKSVSPSTTSSGMTSYSSLPRSITPVQSAAPEETNHVLTIVVRDFEKRGDGMNAYLVYKVVTTSENVPGISDRTFEVWRRFSDFLGLRDKLAEKHQSKGIVVPAAPEKSIAAMTKTKTSSESSLSSDVAVRRARQLERFLRRVVQHPRMRTDCDVRDFLTMEADLPHATSTVALSSEGVKRMFKSVGEVFSKMAFHMEEGDRWFEQTQSHVDELDESLRKLLGLAEGLASTRKDLSHAQESMSRGLSMLASCEESTALARALSHLTETEENAAALWAKQAEMDSIRFSESISEYVGLLGSLKEVFGERVRVWQHWQSIQQLLQKKREQKARMELAGKNDKATQMRSEIDETQRKMDQLEQDFGDLSKLIRDEVGRFETQRRHDMKTMLIGYLESLIQTHTDMLRLWEKFEPETQSIIV